MFLYIFYYIYSLYKFYSHTYCIPMIPTIPMFPSFLQIVLLVSILLCLYLLVLLLQKRNSYFHLQWNKKTQESFMIKNSFTPITEKYASMPLKEYVIKSSFHSAYGVDRTISHDNLIKIIKEEKARVLDFELFVEKDEIVVGFADNYKQMVTSNTERFDQLMDTVAQYAFGVNIGSDPLFLHLRIHSNKQPVLSEIASILEYSFKGKMYESEVTPNTPLKNLLNKVVVLINVSPHYSSKYSKVTCPANAKECVSLEEVAHMDIIGVSEDRLVSQSIRPITPKVNSRRTNVQNYTMTMPDLNNYKGSHTDAFLKLVANHGVQIALFQFYLVDDSSNNLDKYRQFFEKNGSAFVSMTAAVAYAEEHGDLEN